MYILLLISIFLNIILIINLFSMNNKLKEIILIIDDIRYGNYKRRILATDNGKLSEIIYKINEIVYTYDEKIMDFSKKEKSNNQLLTNFSHDIRTPLTSIIGYIDAIKKELRYKNYDDCKEIINYIDIVREKSYHLKEYLDNIFDWFKLNSDEYNLNLECLEITELSREIIKNWILIFEEKDISFDIEIEEKEIKCNIDKDAYSRILNNIIQNAVEHSKTKKIYISIREESKNLIINIKDEGIGISKDNLVHIFDRLYKCNQDRNDKGSGLGLFITKELVEKMNGSINVESSLNKGSNFKIEFKNIRFI
ncbi:sensor histidine kinase [Peptacetobacter sp.]|uniref:sensor histidine kinase n=2 Tax=Peptacetobacter sp. TaxID=2991975 RepID=UPI00262548FD|nr:HAMP domain-containing sensor histidine kinase [Peptacetobacter sp.]